MMRISVRCWFVAAAGALALLGPGAARSDTVTQWNAIASTAIVVTAGQSPQASALSFGMVQGAVYDAVNAIDGGYRPYLVAPAARPMDSKDAAAATAAFRVLVGFPDCNGGGPAGGLASGDPIDWDGLEGDVDGTIGGHYLGC